MGVLAAGGYTHGNKTWTQIKAITGAKVGDTVFDTTYRKRRMWDGDNFIHGHSVSLENSFTETVASQDGYVVCPDPSEDNMVRRSYTTADIEIIVGVFEDVKTSTDGDVCPVCYFGYVDIWGEGGSGGNAIVAGDFLKQGTVSQGHCEDVAAGANVFANYIGADITVASGSGKAIFRPIERY